ncbi:MAG TPA: RidA family protein [Candidatus Limnocylindria bacterium]|nr:RidA family protein [Candidatus Limnocylindria bacterium]
MIRLPSGYGRAVKAGGMIYVSAMGPIDLESGQVVGLGIEEQARQCMKNLKARLEKEGSSLEQVVWANWSLRDASEFDLFNEEWLRWYPDDAPVGQCTLLPPVQRRAGFRISIGVIAQA